jgi:hypothetical protein
MKLLLFQLREISPLAKYWSVTAIVIGVVGWGAVLLREILCLSFEFCRQFSG